MVGLFHGLPGARRFRQILSTDATKPGAGPDVLKAAFAAVDFGRTEQAA
jgi:tRNA-dihydrouridine synthase A